MPEEQIQNYYVAKVKPGKHSLIIPLGAKADIILNTGPLSPGNYQLRLLDISGAEWSKEVVIR
jgi:thiosulfate dehydrogenase [quinone] large subunit